MRAKYLSTFVKCLLPVLDQGMTADLDEQVQGTRVLWQR